MALSLCPLLPSMRTRTLKHAKATQRMDFLCATLFFWKGQKTGTVPVELVNKIHQNGDSTYFQIASWWRSSLWPCFCWPFTSAKTHHLLCDIFIIYCSEAQRAKWTGWSPLTHSLVLIKPSKFIYAATNQQFASKEQEVLKSILRNL